MILIGTISDDKEENEYRKILQQGLLSEGAAQLAMTTKNR